MRRSTALLAAALPLAGILTGCSSAVVTQPAQDANNPTCAQAMLRTPDEISGQKRRTTTSQGNTAYGEPASIVVTCGVEVPGPTTDKCLTVDGIDWILKESTDPGASPSHTWTATTYGTEPALQVVLDADRIPSSDVLPDLKAAAKTLTKSRSCS